MANELFCEAEDLRARGAFSEADKKYDGSFLMQMGALGHEAAASSLEVADTLYGKAENARMQGDFRMAEVRMLY